jgi:hypothetical protein
MRKVRSCMSTFLVSTTRKGYETQREPVPSRLGHSVNIHDLTITVIKAVYSLLRSKYYAAKMFLTLEGKW